VVATIKAPSSDKNNRTKAFFDSIGHVWTAPRVKGFLAFWQESVRFIRHFTSRTILLASSTMQTLV
jgi:hypothetical protein